MRARLQVTPYAPGPLLTVEPPPRAVVEPPPPSDYSTRAAIAARVVACRACPHVATGASTCADCDLRCAHPAAAPGAQLIARRSSTCPAGLWPLIA